MWQPERGVMEGKKYNIGILNQHQQRSLHVRLLNFLSFYLSVDSLVCPSICPSFHPSVYSSVRLNTCPFFHQSVYSLLHLSIYPSIFTFSLSVYTFVRPSKCPSIAFCLSIFNCYYYNHFYDYYSLKLGYFLLERQQIVHQKQFNCITDTYTLS